MATVNYSLDTGTSASAITVVWETLTSANAAGQAFKTKGLKIESVQFIGTFGSATAVLEGSNDGGTTWFGLKDNSNTAISATVAGGMDVLTQVDAIRPSTSGGGGTQDIDCFIFMRDE